MGNWGLKYKEHMRTALSPEYQYGLIRCFDGGHFAVYFGAWP